MRLTRVAPLIALSLLPWALWAQTTPAPRARASVTAVGGELESDLLRLAPTLRPEALHAALSAWTLQQSRGEIMRPFLTVIDYGLPSTTKRLWVFDLDARRLLFQELVAHGRNSGEDLARSFSNEDGSLMTS